MRYVFLALVLINALMFGYYSFLHQPTPSVAVKNTDLTNPVTVTDVSSELPALIGSKK